MCKNQMEYELEDLQEKECRGECPKCGSENVQWDGPDPENDYIYYKGICLDCDCDFREWYHVEYTGTVYSK